MNRITTRLATIGGIIVLGVFALVLAQNDARNRERDQPEIEPLAPQVAVPIPIDEGSEHWATSTTSPEDASTSRPLLVRANNDALSGYGQDRAPKLPSFPTQSEFPAELESPVATDLPDESGYSEELDHSEEAWAPSEPLQHQETLASNPLRQAAHDLLDQSQVVLAGAGLPVEPPSTGLPSTTPSTTQQSSAASPPPAWLGGAAPIAGAPTPSSVAPATLPAFPMAATTTVPSMPPPTLSNGPGSMSDVQRGAMQPTNLLPPNLSAPAASLPAAPVSAANNPPASPFPATPAGGAATSPFPTPAVDNPQSPPPLRTAALANLVSNQPGNRYLDGSQNPNMHIQKRAPEEIQVGKKATFVIAVRNAGNATAHDVRVVDSVPQGSRFIDAVPAATPDAQGHLSWSLGEMAAGDERTITLQIVPEVQGEVGSNALVYFAAQASVRTVATLPKLELQLSSQPDMLVASRQQISVTVKNTGTGVARGVRLEADLPAQIKNDRSDAPELAASLGDMRPGEVQTIMLDVTAVAPGQAAIAFRAISDDGLLAEQQAPLEVLAPQLTASIEGPKLRYLERQATYQIKVKNAGTAAATNLDFVVHLPAGLKYNSANNRGTYDPAQHTVSWGLYELPAGQSAPIELTVLPVDLGAQAISFTATGDLGLRAEAAGTVTVEGLAEVAYTIGQDNGTIEVGTSTTYSVQLTNVGNKSDRDVRLVVQLPAGSQLMKVDAQVSYRSEGNQLIFEPIPEMRNKDQYTYRFQVQHNQPGTQIVRAQLTSANWPVAVIKEEGTLVYNDQN